MPKAKPKPKGKGKGLSKKMGPFPTYVWLILGVVAIGIIYIYYKRRQSSSTAGSLNQSVIPSGVISPNQNNGASGGTTSDSGSPNVFPSDYASQSDLLAAIQAIESSTAAAIAAATFPQPQPTPANPSPGTTGLTTPVPGPNKLPTPTSPTVTKKTTSKTSTPSTAPKAVTITANKTGGSANKKQGVFAIH